MMTIEIGQREVERDPGLRLPSRYLELVGRVGPQVERRFDAERTRFSRQIENHVQEGCDRCGGTGIEMDVADESAGSWKGIILSISEESSNATDLAYGDVVNVNRYDVPNTLWFFSPHKAFGVSGNNGPIVFRQYGEDRAIPWPTHVDSAIVFTTIDQASSKFGSAFERPVA